MKLSNSNIKKNLSYFLKRKLFLHLGKWKPRKKSLYFRKQNFLIFQEVTLRARKIKETTLEKKVSHISANATFLNIS